MKIACMYFRFVRTARTCLTLACVLLSCGVMARTSPAAPTSDDEVVITLSIFNICEDALKDSNNAVRVENFVITYVYAKTCNELGPFSGVSTGFIEIQFSVGKLPPGTYQVKAPDKLWGTSTILGFDNNPFVVNARDAADPAAIPATHPFGLVVLALLLVGVVRNRLLAQNAKYARG
jgi:hypothetical protein